jgi:type II secretory pathway pseudopilin PulG
MRTSTAGSRCSRGAARAQRGFTYALVMVSLIVIGIAAEGAHLLTARVLQADREAELIFRGLAIRRAIEAYYRDHQRYPRSLEDLVRDPGSATRRYLRELYADPMAPAAAGERDGGRASAGSQRGLARGGRAQAHGWHTFETADGGISGVASRSKALPLKRANFPAEIEQFKEAENYSEWEFQFLPLRNRLPGTPGVPAAAQ